MSEQTDTPGSDNARRCRRLLELLGSMRSAGAAFTRFDGLDGMVDAGEPAVLLKHDIHGLDLDGLIDLADRERSLGIAGNFFFMAPDHPHTLRAYRFDEQAECMRTIMSMGHEIGLHLDPYFLMDSWDVGLAEVCKRCLGAFAEAGCPVSAANTHGNSRFKFPDLDGYATSFELFDEIARHDDFPALSRLPEQTARLVRAERISLDDLGIRHFADNPAWSSRHGIVATSFLTDNRLGKDGTVELVINPEGLDCWALARRQPPGSRNRPEIVRKIPLVCKDDSPAPEGGRTGFDDPALDGVMAWFARRPLLVLIHPQFYV